MSQTAASMVTEWNEFKQLDLERVRSSMKQPVLFDGRNIYDPEVMQRQGFHYRGFGRGYNGGTQNGKVTVEKVAAKT
jgi:UDPglucose 6-dehydrogenase